MFTTLLGRTVEFMADGGKGWHKGLVVGTYLGQGIHGTPKLRLVISPEPVNLQMVDRQADDCILVREPPFVPKLPTKEE